MSVAFCGVDARPLDAHDIGFAGGAYMFGGATVQGTVGGIDAVAASCRNFTVPQTVGRALPGPGLQEAWDCERLGLMVAGGDQIALSVRGVAATDEFMGSATGLAVGAVVRCVNETQGVRLRIPLTQDGRWDCGADELGLVPGDQVSATVLGTALGTLR
ncbi:MAG: hypothetical protein AAGA68_15210 [Pseudomonadota bacterium]